MILRHCDFLGGGKKLFQKRWGKKFKAKARDRVQSYLECIRSCRLDSLATHEEAASSLWKQFSKNICRSSSSYIVTWLCHFHIVSCSTKASYSTYLLCTTTVPHYYSIYYWQFLTGMYYYYFSYSIFSQMFNISQIKSEIKYHDYSIDFKLHLFLYYGILR